MGTVLQLANFRNNLVRRPSGARLDTQLQGRPEFTSRDRCDLDAWVAPDRRVAIGSCDTGTYAMLYNGKPWASWGVVRQDRLVLVWDCVSLADIGRYPSMLEALAALPVTRRAAVTHAVLPFDTSRRHRAAG